MLLTLELFPGQGLGEFALGEPLLTWTGTLGHVEDLLEHQEHPKTLIYSAVLHKRTHQWLLSSPS